MARAITNTIETTVFGFLSSAVFIATFLVAGDVLIAASVAAATAIAQILLRRSAHRKTGILVWASLALVIALTGLTLNGDEADAASAAFIPVVAHSRTVTPNCHCHAPLQIDASASVLTEL